MISLARAAWNISLAATTVKLRAAGLVITEDKSAITTYEDWLERREEFQQLWEESANGTLFTNPALDQLAQNLHVTLPEVAEHWEIQGPRQIAGGIKADEVTLVFQPNAARSGINYKEGRAKADSGSSTRLFRGRQKDWKYVLVVPYYDLPGRIHDFTFIGRKGRADEDYVHRRVTTSSSNDHSAGIAFHPDLLKSKGVVYGMRDTQRYLQMQMRHYKIRNNILPLVTWHDDDKCRPEQAWKMFQGRRIVLWGEELTPSLLLQAIRANAEISLAGPKNKTKERYSDWFSRLEPQQLLKLLERQAKPWPEAVAEHIRFMADDQVEDLFLQLQFCGEDTGRIASQCPPKTRRKIKRVLQRPLVGISITIDNATIEDQNEGWVKRDAKGKEEVHRLLNCIGPRPRPDLLHSQGLYH